jgi:hypothetical protein
MDWNILPSLEVGTPIRVTRGYWKNRDGYIVGQPDAPHDAKSLYIILVDRIYGIMPGNVKVQRKSLTPLADPTPHSPPVDSGDPTPHSPPVVL